mmetsp:Transcript_7407/g.16930  ORF Transcript_7407/g.16930 Transcript_7407/m.16930 type:complete len:437 (+) Transcript_7407:85-1395(+)
MQPEGTKLSPEGDEPPSMPLHAWEAAKAEAGEVTGASGVSSSASRGPGATKIALVVATVIVDALAPLMQEKASRSAGFTSSSMVLAETMSYYLGGLALGGAWGGLGGLRRCLRPTRYVAFLPASAAFSASNFLTYIAVRGLGASQFYLLAQLRVALLAIFLRFWSGVRQPVIAWLSILQLAAGMVVLVMYKANSACGTSSHEAVAETAVAAERAEFVSGILALAGVVLTSAFGFIYLEWQLKANAQDPLFIQLHQMNSFGAAAALVIHMGHNSGALDASQASARQGLSASLAVNSSASLQTAGNATAGAASAHLIAEEPASEMYAVRIGLLLACIVARGVLAGSVLKQLDAIAKGLIDVTAIVLCTVIQIGVQGPESANGTALGIQLLMLLSILSYSVARSPSPGMVQAPKAYDKPAMLELPSVTLPGPRRSPKVL